MRTVAIFTVAVSLFYGRNSRAGDVPRHESLVSAPDRYVGTIHQSCTITVFAESVV